jgi:hypothetical protein
MGCRHKHVADIRLRLNNTTGSEQHDGVSSDHGFSPPTGNHCLPLLLRLQVRVRENVHKLRHLIRIALPLVLAGIAGALLVPAVFTFRETDGWSLWTARSIRVRSCNATLMRPSARIIGPDSIFISACSSSRKFGNSCLP